MMFERLYIEIVVQLHCLDIVFKFAKILKPPHQVGIGRYLDEALDNESPTPSLALVLSSVSHYLRQTNNVRHIGDGYKGAVMQKAPPQIETAASALLRLLKHLTHLELYYVKFKSITQLLGVIRAQLHIQNIFLDSIEVLQAIERFYWPPSLVLTKLQDFLVRCCVVSTNAIPVFLSLAL